MYVFYGHLSLQDSTTSVGEDTYIDVDSTTGLPSLVKRLYTHGAVTVDVPYVWSPTSSYPRGITAAAATAALSAVCVCRSALTAAGYTTFTLAGYHKDAVTSGTIAADKTIEVLNGGAAFIDAGTTAPVGAAESCGVALEAAASNVADVWLYGDRVEISAS